MGEPWPVVRTLAPAEVGQKGRVAAKDDAGLPADPDFRAAMRAYMEWAVADVLVYSPVDAHVPDGVPMPHWSWDGLRTAAR